MKRLPFIPVILALLAFMVFANESSGFPNKYMTTSEKAERTCLAKNIYFEARSQGNPGQQSVGYVTLNRVMSDKYPNTICEVVWQKAQFSWTHDGKSDIPKDIRAWKRAVMNARYVIKNYLLDITQGSMYYHANYVKPYWSVHMIKTTTIGHHIFYK